MKRILLSIFTICFLASAYGQTVIADSLLKNVSALNGEWIWVKSTSGGYAPRTPETEKQKIKIIIKELSIMEIYQNNKLIKTATFKKGNITDMSVARNLQVIWARYKIEYFSDTIAGRKYIYIHNNGTFDLWSKDYLEITDDFISGSTASSFKKMKN